MAISDSVLRSISFSLSLSRMTLRLSDYTDSPSSEDVSITYPTLLTILDLLLEACLLSMSAFIFAILPGILLLVGG